MIGDYYGYTESHQVSPMLIQNFITNYNFDSDGGWVASAEQDHSVEEAPKAESTCGRFVGGTGGKFISLIDDFCSGEYDEENEYKSYMKISFKKED
jgi:hypothetical protein